MLILKIRQVADVEFNGIEKVHEGAFINRYNLTYTTKDNKKKVYEMISRNRNIDSEDQIRNPKTDGVVIIMTDEDDEHILLNREFRMAVDDILKVGEICEVSGRVVKAGVYSEKNTEYLNYNGTIVKNISIGSDVLIRKGFSNIIGRVEGEFMKEELSEPFKQLNKRNSVNRIVGIGILGALENDKFVHGVTNLPMIGNYVYVVTEDVISGIFSKNAKDKITLGTLIAYEEYPFEVNVQDLLCSHIGIFGNTGSGKSNTLAKLYREVVEKYKTNKNFNQNAKFVIIDFNGEYSKVFDNANIYKLSTRTRRNKNKYPISYEDIFEGEFWSIILEATDKTQKPFIDRCIRKY